MGERGAVGGGWRRHRDPAQQPATRRIEEPGVLSADESRSHDRVVRRVVATAGGPRTKNVSQPGAELSKLACPAARQSINYARQSMVSAVKSTLTRTAHPCGPMLRTPTHRRNGQATYNERMDHVQTEEARKPWLISAGLVVAFIAAVNLALHLYAGRRYGYFVDELYYLACTR